MMQAAPGTDFYVYLVDFLVLFTPVAYLVLPKAKAALAGRHDAMKADLDEARARFEEAEARLKAAEERLTHLNEETARLMEEFRQRGSAERDTLAHEGSLLAEKIRVEADFRLDQAVKMARSELADAVVSRAFALVEARLASRATVAPVPDAVVDRVVREVKP
jgi:F0F1-type ATP synthase membrane subunit b/b'